MDQHVVYPKKVTIVEDHNESRNLLSASPIPDQKMNGNQNHGANISNPGKKSRNSSLKTGTSVCNDPDMSVSGAPAKKKDLRKFLRRLSSIQSVNSVGSSISTGSIPIEKLRSKIDVIQSHLDGRQANGDDDFDLTDFEDDPFINTIKKLEEVVDQSESECEDNTIQTLRLSANHLKELRKVLESDEIGSIRSMDFNQSDNSKQDQEQAQFTSPALHEDVDDDNDLLADKLENSALYGNMCTPESVSNVLQKASILPCPLRVLKPYMVEEREEMRDLQQLIAMTGKNDEVFGTAPAVTTRKVAGKSSIFRTQEEAGAKSTGARKQKRSSLEIAKNLFSMLSKSDLKDGDNKSSFIDHRDSSTLQEMNPEKMNIHATEQNRDSEMYNAFEHYAYFPPLDDFTDDKLKEDESLMEAFILHFIFRKFSTPPPSFHVVENVLEYERRRISNGKKFAHSHRRQSIHHIPLSQDLVVNLGDSSIERYPGWDKSSKKSSLVTMILETDILLQLPLHFRLAFLRMLIRILTGESDQEYDTSLSLEPARVADDSEKISKSGGWKNKSNSFISPQKIGLKVGRTKSWRNEDLRYLHDRNAKRNSLSFHGLYSVVRFCCCEHPGRHIDIVIGMIESLIGPLETENRKSRSLIMYPLCRLLGLLCTAGLSAQQMRKILSLIRDDTFRMNVNIHVLRALIVAAEGSSLARKLKGKASPQSFFNFGRSNGITKTIYPAKNTEVTNAWPFKMSFGMSCWFRIEDFRSNYDRSDGEMPRQRLFKICSGDGTAFEISFKLLGSTSLRSLHERSDAAHVVFSVRDSDVTRKEAQTPLSRGIELIGCPIVPRVWFHIAIRHTKKSYLSLSKDEVTILLDGKPMLTECLKFPKASSLGHETGQSRQRLAQPIEITFCSGIDAQAGSLYVFDNAVSDETFYSLYKFTSGKSETFLKQSERPGIIEAIESKVHSAASTSPFVDDDSEIITLKKADVEEMVIPRMRSSSGNGKQVGGRASNTVTSTLDLIGDDEFCNEIHNPTKGEFSRQAFVSNIYFVWDPNRVCDNLVLEAHSGIHARLHKINCVPWKMRSAKDVIATIGGIQSLLPTFRSLIIPETVPRASAIQNECKTFETGIAIPLALSLLAAFLRDKDTNGREWIRCGGTEILEYFLLQSKERYASTWNCSSHKRELWVHLNSFRRHKHFAEELVSILIDLTEACSFNKNLQSRISSRLIFNVDLWFGGLGKIPGTALQSVLLPVLSSITKADPEQASISIRTSLMMNLVREYTIVPKLSEKSRHTFSNSMHHSEVMTKSERDHLVDIVMGILLTVLSVEVNISNLLPVIQFISFNLEKEWEKVNSSGDGEGENHRSDPDTRVLRFNASEKSCSLIVLLLQSRPVIPGLFKTLNQIVGDTVSWLLCCMVNSYDDKMRSNGIRCITALYDAILLQIEEEQNGPSRTMLGAKRAVSKVSRTIKNVGAGLGVLPKVFDTSAKSLTVSYKLLWHFLKSHSSDLGANSHAALVDLLVHDPAGFEPDSILSKYLVSDDVLLHGYHFHHKLTDIKEAHLHSPMLRLRSNYASSTVLQLLRYLPSKEQEQWLFDLLTLLRVNDSTVEGIIQTRDWQHCLFHVASDTVEELSNYNIKKWQKENYTDSNERVGDDNSNVFARFDLSFQLYSMLLGRCLRDDNDCIGTLELAASLQRVCVNGVAVFSILLSHVLNDLITSGTLFKSDISFFEKNEETAGSDNSILKQCAMTFFQMEVNQAAKHWKKLRHLIAIVVATVTSNGYGLVDLFDYRNNLSSIVDGNSGGVFGIRLGDQNSAGILAVDVMVGTRSLRNQDGEDVQQNVPLKQYYRRICTTLSSQVLELLDPYIFPDHIDVTIPTSHQQSSALIQSVEHRLGNAQGPLVISLVRLSLVLLSQLEPSSIKFVKICSMLRCFLHWCLDIVHESSAQPDALKEKTESIDRIIVCIVLLCHRCLSKCSAVVTELELSPDKYFSATDQTRHLRRLFRAVEILGDIVLDVYKGRNAILQKALSGDAYKALELSIATKDEWAHSLDESHASNTQNARKIGIRSFLDADWIKQFHDIVYVQSNGNGFNDMPIPEQLSTLDETGDNSNQASVIMNGIATESRIITEEYNRALDSPFLRYLEEQRKWADTSAVRDLEYDGNLSIKNLAEQYLRNNRELVRAELLKADLASQRLLSIERKIFVGRTTDRWKLAQYTDRLHRRILLVPNRNFDDHASASYDLALGIEREKALKEREERLRAKREQELASMYQLAKEGIIKQPVELDDLLGTFEDNDEVNDIESGNDSNSRSSDDQSLSVEPLSDDDVAPGELITDWDRIDADDIPLDGKHDKGSHLWSKDYIWQHGEKLVFYLESVQLVTVQTILIGELVLTTHSLYFRRTEDPISVMTKETVSIPNTPNSSDSVEDTRWRLNRLSEVHERRYLLRTQALELFFADTHELFINFCGGRRVRDKFVDKLRQCKTPLLSLRKNLNPKAVFRTRFSGLTQQWQQRKISNFEYLMQLNIIAGRTFNDVSQYPVFPWIIADYTSNELDLNDPKSFRDLTKPVGALNPDRLLQLLERYHDLDGLPDEERFLYGSHYSSPGAVLHFLIRQEPFTTMAIELQSGRFDCPDRLFYDISACWQSCLQSTSDVKELVPELFTCPEMLLNTNNFPLGETQTKRSISNVKLPPWANGSAHEFIRLNRLALESEYVSCNLHHWIDLVFGFKQRGLEAVKANNIFHFLSYEGSVDLDKITDEIDRNATESQIQNFGQTPSQMLTTPHPCRFSAKKCWKPIISELAPTRRLMCYTPFKQFGGNRSLNQHGPVVSIQLLTDHVVVVYADLSVGTYKWSPTKHGKTPFYLKMNNIRPIASREMSISKFAMGFQNSSEQSNESKSPNTFGSIGIGNWSFAMTVSSGNKTQFESSKTKMGSLAKSKETSSNYIDATLISCGYWDNALKAHSLDGLRLKCSETGGHLGAINCLRLGEDGTLLITGGDDATCRLWTAENSYMGSALIDSYVKTAQDRSPNAVLMCCLVLWGHGSPISSLTFDTDLDIVVSGSVDGTICIHTVRRGEFIRSLQVADFFPPANILATESDGVDSCNVRKLAINKDGTFVAHLETGLLQMYTINGVKLGCIDAGEKLHAMEMIPGGHSLVTGGESGHVIIRSLRNLGIRYVLDLSDYGPIHCITFTPPPLHSRSIRQFMFVGTQDGSITVACAQREENADFEEDEEPGSAQYTQHQAFKRKEAKSWWR